MDIENHWPLLMVNSLKREGLNYKFHSSGVCNFRCAKSFMRANAKRLKKGTHPFQCYHALLANSIKTLSAQKCDKKHANPSIECAVGMANEIVLTFGKVCIGLFD